MGQRQLGQRHLKVGRALIKRAATDEILFNQFLVAVEVRAHDRDFSLSLLGLGLRELVVQLHQQLTPTHPLAITEVDLRDAPADFRPDDHILARPQAAHRLRLIHQRGPLHQGYFHCWLATPRSAGSTAGSCGRGGGSA